MPTITTTIGIDLSTRATGICGLRSNGARGFRLVKPKATLPLSARIDQIVNKILRIVLRAKPDAIGIEGLIVGKNAKGSLSLAQLGGAVRHRLRLEGYSYTDIPPGALKRYATGKGNASKAMMVEACFVEIGERVDDNLADAYFLALMVRDEDRAA